MLTHVGAKDLVDTLGGISPLESLFMRMVAWHETKYGSAWQNAGVGSNNMGAITAPESYEGETFVHADSRWDDRTQSIVRYETQFKRYPTATDGFADLRNMLLKQNVRDAIANRSIQSAARAMRENKYFIGTRPFKEAVNAYANALRSAYHTIHNATNEGGFADSEPPLFERDTSPDLLLLRAASALPILQRGSLGDAVRVWQLVVGAEVDGSFGKHTKEKTQAWQTAHELLDDGIVGPKTWIALAGSAGRF